MALDPTERPQTLTEAGSYYGQAVVDFFRLTNALAVNGATVAEMVANLYAASGMTDAEAKAKGSEVLRLAQGVDANLVGLTAGMKAIRMKINQAQVHKDEHEAKRRTARAKLG